MSTFDEPAKANDQLLSGNGDAALEIPPPTLNYRGGSNGAPGGSRASAEKPASKCACCCVCGVVMLALLSVAVLAVAVAVAWHQYELGDLKAGLNTTIESGNYYSREIQQLRDDVITLRLQVKNLEKNLRALADSNSTGGARFGKLDLTSRLDYAKLDQLLDANDDTARQEALEMITPFKNDPAYTSDPEFLRRLATVQYFSAMNVLSTNPNAKDAALQTLIGANVTIYNAYNLAVNKSALLYKWMGVIEGKYGTLNLKLSIQQRVQISLRAYRWLKQSSELDATDPGTFYALGNWHYKVSSLGGIEKSIFNAVAGSANPSTSYTHAVQSYNQSVVLYTSVGRQRIGALTGLARALYKRNSGSDRTQANAIWKTASAVVPVSADDRLEKDDLKNGLDFVPK